MWERRERAEIPPYIVPLSRQAIELVKALLATKLPSNRHLLPHRSRPKDSISESTLNTALQRMGYKGRLTGHCIRGTLQIGVE